ncbi:hypothetical protein LCGC14_2990120, partial [marine sediment metagenome]
MSIILTDKFKYDSATQISPKSSAVITVSIKKLSLTNAAGSYDDIITANREFTLQSIFAGAGTSVDMNFVAPADKDLTTAFYADGEGGAWSPNFNVVVSRTSGLALEATGYLNIHTSDTIGTTYDSDDYIRIQTTSNVPEITTIGVCDLKINAGGNDLLLNHGGGNVGIGTATPQELLHVGTGTDASDISATDLLVTRAGPSSLSVRDSTNNVET